MTDGADTGFKLGRVGTTRLLIGLTQGLLSYALYRAVEAKFWPATDPAAFATVFTLLGLVPLILLGGAGGMRPRTLLGWTLAAGAVVTAFAAHAATRSADGLGSPALFAALVGAVWVFVGHHLVHGADQSRRLVAPYPVYFDLAWKHAVQLVLAYLFLGVFWLVLLLGAALFGLIGVKAVGELIAKPWFFLPVSAAVFAAAVHLTDVRASLTRGARTLALALLSWLTPLMGGLTIAFLLALPFTGLKPLFEIGSATAILLGAAAALIVFLNAAYQDGETPPPAVLRWSGRAVAVALAPLLAIAAYGLWLRVGQYGWTPSRVVVAACVLVGSVYAVGYAAAALIPGGAWMKRLEATNVFNAVVVLLVLLALCTPLADPARIAVGSQVARLERGAVSPDEFDWDFLRFRSARYGAEALKRLAKSADPKVAAAAQAAQNRESPLSDVPVDRVVTQVDLKAIKIFPAGRSLPASLAGATFPNAYVPCLTTTESGCEAYFADLDGDRREELLVAQNGSAVVLAETTGGWRVVGRFMQLCEADQDGLRAGRFAPVARPYADLESGGRTLRFTEEDDFAACPGRATAAVER